MTEAADLSDFWISMDDNQLEEIRKMFLTLKLYQTPHKRGEIIEDIKNIVHSMTEEQLDFISYKLNEEIKKRSGTKKQE